MKFDVSVDLKNVSGVYMITCLPTGKIYIGSGLVLSKRYRSHVRRLRRGDHHSPKLQNAWNKHGENAFSFNAILICSSQDCVRYEQSFIDFCNPELNCDPRAGSRLGTTVTDETKAKLSASLRAVNSTTEAKARRAEVLSNPETRRKMSESAKARFSRSDEVEKHRAGQKKRFSDPTQGKAHAERIKKNFQNNPHLREEARQRALRQWAEKGKSGFGR